MLCVINAVHTGALDAGMLAVSGSRKQVLAGVPFHFALVHRGLQADCPGQGIPIHAQCV